MTNADRIAQLEDGHFWFRARDQLFDDLIGQVRGATVVDAGCGTGSFAARIAAHGARVVAVDPHLPSETQPYPHFVSGSAEHLPLSDGTCDVVLARDVLEHVDDRAAVAEFRRVLRVGGRVIVAVPAWPSLWSHRDVQAEHLRRYRRRQLVSLLQDGGFVVAHLRGYQFLLLPAFVVSRLVTRRTPHDQLRREERVHPILNRALHALNTLEVAAGGRRWLRPPTGSSYVAVGIRRD